MKNVIFGSLAVAVIALGMVWFKDVKAHHEADHRVLYVNVVSELPLKIVVCDTAKQMELAYDASIKHGERGWQFAFQMLNQMRNDEGEPVCGVAVSLATVKEVINRGTTPDGMPMTFARIELTDGERYAEYYTVLPNVEVTDDSACVNCI